MLHQRRVCQQKWLRMGFEIMPAPTREVNWNRGRDNPEKQDVFKPLGHRSTVLNQVY